MYQNKFNVALPLAVWLATDEYKYAKFSNEISTTTLLKSPRYIIGTRRQMYPEDWEEHLRIPTVNPDSPYAQYPDIQDSLASRIGTAIHSAVEHAWISNASVALEQLGQAKLASKLLVNPKPEDIKPDSVTCYMEQRLYKEIDGFTISGQFDMVLDGNLHDIKTTGVYSYTSGCNDEKYMLQGSIYRWLNPELITRDFLTINFVFTNWNPLDAQTKESYPPAKCISKQFKLLSLQETEMYIRNKIKLLHKYWNTPLMQIPCCTEKELFTKPSTYKYYKNGYVEGARSTRNFDSMASASAYRAKQGFIGDIIEVRAKPFVCPFCNPREVNDMMSVPVSKRLNIS